VSYVSKKSNPRWLWHAIDRRTGQVLAYVFGRRNDEIVSPTQRLLEPLSKSSVLMDGVPTKDIYQRKCMKWVNGRLRIERKHLRLRTRIDLPIRTICFSKSEVMHDLVIGLFINRYEFGISI